MEFRIVRKDGEVIWAAMSWLPIYDNSGLSLGVRASIRDVTDEKQSFDAMLTAKSELERMLFAASHDLREPLREILIFSQLLQRQLGGTLPEPAGQSLSAIRRGAEQMGALVQGLMAFSRSGRTMTSFEVIDCRAVVESAVSQCADGSSEVRFEIGPLPKLPGDGALLLIMFENLICNAIKFRRTDAPAWVKISAEAEADGWRIDVADNGIGMAEVDLQTIVRPFSRVHPRASFPGAGLGLASATRVAGIHGGRLWLDSTLGEGTTAHVWLPTASEHVTSAATCPA
jgi:signal transduction histidine kinase